MITLADGGARTDAHVVAAVDMARTRREFARGDRWLAYWFDQYFVAPTALAIYAQLRALRNP